MLPIVVAQPIQDVLRTGWVRILSRAVDDGRFARPVRFREPLDPGSYRVVQAPHLVERLAPLARAQATLGRCARPRLSAWRILRPKVLEPARHDALEHAPVVDEHPVHMNLQPTEREVITWLQVGQRIVGAAGRRILTRLPTRSAVGEP